MHTFNMRARAAVASIALAAASASAMASPLLYAFTGVGSGTLDTMSFSDAAFTITATTDTGAIASCGGSCLYSDSLGATVSIAGLGTYAFVSATRTFWNQGALGFARSGADSSDLYDGFFGGVIDTYDLSTAVATVSTIGAIYQWKTDPVTGPTFAPVVTSGGVLEMADGTSPMTFTAFAPGVPEPAAPGLMLAGLAVIRIVTRRRPR